MTSRHDKYDIHEDDSDTTGSKDDRKYDAVRRSMSFVNC